MISHPGAWKTWKFTSYRGWKREKRENSQSDVWKSCESVKIHTAKLDSHERCENSPFPSVMSSGEAAGAWKKQNKFNITQQCVFFGPIHCTIGILWLHGPTLWLSNFCGLLQIDSNLKSTYMWSRPYHEADLWSVAIYLARSKHRSYLKDEKLVITFHSSVFLKVCGWLPSKELQLLFQLLILLLLLLEPWKSRRVRCMERIEAPLDPFSHVPRYAHGTFMAVLFPYGASNMNSRAWLKQNCENGRPFISRTYCVFF